MVALKNGGLDLADASPVTRENLRRREYHHLYPTSLLKDEGFAENQIYKALNCALVTWKTNRNISAKSPDEYLRQRIDAASLGEDEIRERVQSHLIDYDAFRAGDYEAFLAARAEMIHPLAVELCS